MWMFCFVVCDVAIDGKLAEMTDVDGIIKAKYSNFTGYDLWFPNGTLKWTENLSADYICDDWWYNTPIQLEVQYFDPKGAAVVCAISVLITALFTVGFPMLILISKQAAFIRELMGDIDKWNKQAIEYMFNAVSGSREAYDEEIAGHPGNDKALEESLLRSANMWRMVGIVWMACSIVAMFCVSVVLVNLVMTAKGWPAINKRERLGYCYYVDRSNMSYTASTSSALRMLEEEEDAGELAPAQALVMVESDNARTFYGPCTRQIYEPSKSMDIVWTITPEFYPLCNSNISVLSFDGYHVESLYGCNPGKKCNADFSWSEGFDGHLLSGCSKHDGSPAPDKFLKKDKGMYGAQSIEQFGKCMLNPKYRMTKHEFKVSKQDGWEKCTWRRNPGGVKVHRSEGGLTKDVTAEYDIHVSIDDQRLVAYPNGWLTRNEGKEVIVLDQTLLATEGSDLKLYWGGENVTGWMMKHFDIGNIEGGYKDPSATLPSFRAINTAAPLLKECEMRMVLDKDVAKEFVEFKQFCPDVKAHIASSGSVYIGTSSNARCVVNIKANISSKVLNTSITIDSMNPYQFYGTEPFYWGCETVKDAPYRAVKCGYKNTSWHSFRPEFMDTMYEVSHNLSYIADVGASQAPASPSKWARVKEFLFSILKVVAIVAVAVIVLVVVLKVTAKMPCCINKCPGIAQFGMNLCSRNPAQLQPNNQQQPLIIMPPNQNDDSYSDSESGNRSRRRGNHKHRHTDEYS